MRIGIDGLTLTEPLTGVGHYTLELAHHLARGSTDDELLVVSPQPFLSAIDFENNRPSNLRFVLAAVNPIRQRWWSIGLPHYIRKNQIQLFHGTNFEVPLWRRCPTVLTIHDLSQYLRPETHEKTYARRARRRLPVMARAANMIVTPGECVREEVCEHLKVSPSRIVAIPEAPREVFRPMPQAEALETRKRLGIGEDFLLFVGTIEPRKNLRALVQAFMEVASARSDSLQLVLAGKRGRLAEDLFDCIRRTGVSDRIKLTGYLCDEELRALYSSCKVFIYPSLYEGFGLPPLEAMACGAPVIASRIPSIVEVTGEAARLVDPENVHELARSIAELLGDEAKRQELSAAGLRRATEFSWRRTAELTREVYREAVERFGKRR